MKDKLKTKITQHWQWIKENRKKILISYLILFSVFIAMFTIDQLTKYLLFEHGDVFNANSQGQVNVGGRWVDAKSIYPVNSADWKNYGIIGVRSVWHKGVTFLDTNNIGLIQAISFIIALCVIFIPLFAKEHSYYYSFGLGFLLAGDLGNATDRIAFLGHVKDEFYLPWYDTGTFNFADICIFIGIIYLIIFMVVMAIIEWKKEAVEENEIDKLAEEATNKGDTPDMSYLNKFDEDDK
ncbi:signal peptidase II [Mycoplasma nasistruthionis]|uniref:Lipoprotein signal peptidase n=1 Tax=Mycoplasma nasistruthionis TaxID=353852 RepID=A0A4Y6I785_9MOLU|nr:signal peptidase II [Mycoplasma nasistruthionis]QCZ36983.1 signal peptidase II [Mycoplasma nasistruthionis]QDF65251.1 signal peptidase II [Mycoplasma nasistruthionis]